MAKVSFSYDDKRLRHNVRKLPSDINGKIQAVGDYGAAYGTTYLKTNAPWTDRTGAARGGITAISTGSGSTIEILMAYTVTYGIWLEIANDRRYAIITPGMRVIGNEIMSQLQGMLNSL